MPGKENITGELKENEKEAVKALDQTVNEKMAWSTRKSKEYAMAAENRIKAVLGSKTSQLTDEIQSIHSGQRGEILGLDKLDLINTQKKVLDFIQQRAYLMLELADVHQSAVNPGEKMVSTPVELAQLGKLMSMVEGIDVQQLVYQALPPEMKESYLEALGRGFAPDLMPLLTRLSKGEEPEEGDFKLLLDRIRSMKANAKPGENNDVSLVMAALPKKYHLTLARKMAQEKNFPHFEQQIITMVGADFLSAVQAAAVLNEKLAVTKNKKDREVLEAALSQVSSRQMGAFKEDQAKQRTIRAAAHYENSSYGHKNHARSLLTLKGIGSALLTVNGAMTVGMNVAMNVTDPANIPLNPMIWLGIAEMGVGLQASGGFGGMVSTPEQMAARVVRDKNEAKDDRLSAYDDDFKKELTHYYREMHFYGTFAERIMQVYKAKKAASLEKRVPISFADIGIKTREDLPPEFRDLWGKQEFLEEKMADWAMHFSSTAGENAGRMPDNPDLQRGVIQDLRKEEGLNALNFTPLEFFEYKPA
ncbi:MAG: hypothetical protein WC777_01030 [Candidatus Gracilibacteria bacterium]|jgi:hypothetical protein